MDRPFSKRPAGLDPDVLSLARETGHRGGGSTKRPGMVRRTFKVEAKGDRMDNGNGLAISDE
jgi:hypothetical protein